MVKLIQHSAVHSDTLYDCEVCGKSFTTEYNKMRHVQNVHAAAKTFECKEYGKFFKTKSEVKQQSAVHSDTIYTCKVSDKVFRHKRRLVAHKKIIS